MPWLCEEFIMTDSEKMEWMFIETYGEMTGSCYVEVEDNDEYEAERVHCMKDGLSCWSKNKAELVFDYLTRHLDA
jgi:hypothetical protein